MGLVGKRSARKTKTTLLKSASVGLVHESATCALPGVAVKFTTFPGGRSAKVVNIT